MNITVKRHDQFPDSILIRKFAGEVNVNEIIASWEYLCENNFINNKIKGVINDLTDCELKMDMESFAILMDYLKMNECFKDIKLAVVTNTPAIVVFPVLASSEYNLMIKPFSTMQAATNWVSQ